MVEEKVAAPKKEAPKSKKTVRVFSQSLKDANFAHTEDWFEDGEPFIRFVDGYADVTPKQAEKLVKQYRRAVTIVG